MIPSAHREAGDNVNQHLTSDRQRRESNRSHASARSLDLVKTRSQEPAVVESIAIPPATDPDEDKIDVIHDNLSDGTKEWPHSTRYLVLLCSFFASLSFGVTQVPLLYVFRLMTCDAYYDKHPRNSLNDSTSRVNLWNVLLNSSSMSPSSTDRCSIHPIESSTALSISLLGASTTIFGLLNLFITGALIKRIGIKRTLLLNLFFPALRLLVQNIGVQVWGYTGIIIVQSSQVLTIVGGPSGYILCLNSLLTEVVEHEGRTAWLGRLTGSMMFGSALGFLFGGIVAEAFNIYAPFRLTLALFLLTCAYVAVFLPFIPSAEKTDAARPETKKRILAQLFVPLAVFGPKKFIATDGTIRTEYGAFLLAWGVYLGILATGYLPTLLQLFATDVFSFGTKENGYLIFLYSMLRGVFLTFAFPKLIAIGRKYVAAKDENEAAPTQDEERQPLLRNSNSHIAGPGFHTHNTPLSTTGQYTFDLTYTRFSLIADGLLTLLCSLVRQGWQMYLVATVLPFAAGTGAAAKGTILSMVGASASSSERTDALAGISLVENMARLSTTFVFGVVFAGFASIGRTELTFTCNAAVAIIGFCVLVFSRFPPPGSRRLEKEQPLAQETAI